jgi:uncharacterized membrane protein YjjP (DUF1212 family)
MIVIPIDKANHFVYGSLCGLLCLVFPWWSGLLAAIILGVVKEYLDHRKYRGADVVDFLITVLGALVVCLPVFLKS